MYTPPMPLHIEPIAPTPPFTADVYDTIDGLHGIYTAADLYQRYLSICTERAHGTFTRVAFGRELNLADATATRDRHGRRAWMI